MNVIYVDTLFVLNFAADWLCLTAAGRLCDRRSGALRRFAASAVGGLYAVGTVMPGMEFMQSAILIPAAALLVVWTAFGADGVLRLTLAFMASAVLLGGTVYAASSFSGMENLFSDPRALRVFLIGAGLCCGGCSAVFRRVLRKTGGSGIMTICAERNGRKTEFHALYDTGNSLRDPVTGDGVVVCEKKAVQDLLTKEEEAAIRSFGNDTLRVLEALSAAEGRWRLVPYSAVGVESGLLPAFRPDRVTVDGKRREHILFALSPGKVSDGGAYSALGGAEMRTWRGK